MNDISLLLNTGILPWVLSLSLGLLFIVLLAWQTANYLKKNRHSITKAALIKTKGKIIKKFFSGDARIGGEHHVKFQFTIDDKNVEVDHGVDQELYLAYEVGDELDIFVANGSEIKVYLLDSLKDVQSKSP